MAQSLSDDSAITSGFARWLARRPEVSEWVTDPRRPSAGYRARRSSWTPLVGERCTTPAPMVIRMAPVAVGTFRHYDLVSQWQAQTAAAAVGVPVADPVVETDPGWLGAPFMVMPLVDGHIIGPSPTATGGSVAHDQADRGRLYRNFVSTVSADPPGRPRRRHPACPAGTTRPSSTSGTSTCRGRVTAIRCPPWSTPWHWCRSHRPAGEPPPVLLWGDVRFENMVFGDDLDRLAVLDWDMTSVGAPEHDLAWFTSLDLTMHHLFGERLDGFPDRAATVDPFEEGSGRPVRDLEWYENLAMVRSTAVMTRISYLRRDAGEPLMLPIDDNPILDLLEERLR